MLTITATCKGRSTYMLVMTYRAGQGRAGQGRAGQGRAGGQVNQLASISCFLSAVQAGSE